MIHESKERGTVLMQELEDRVRRTTHGRIRDLAVEEVQGQVVVRGRVSTHHARQLALQAALDLLPGRSLRACITVG
jgi:hypothetical protein